MDKIEHIFACPSFHVASFTFVLWKEEDCKWNGKGILKSWRKDLRKDNIWVEAEVK